MHQTPVIFKRHVAAAVAGNAMEFYDFTTYALFSVQIGHVFFPGKSAYISLILSLATFGAGFALRPLGAVLIGRYADRVGRKPAMLFSLTLMGASILGLALTPGFAVIGPAAPLLALCWRLSQGFALGGEVGPTTAFLVEASPPARRAFYGAWQTVSQNIANFAGGTVGVVLAHIAGPAGLEAWGWRVALGLGALVLPFGLWLRRSLPETRHHFEAVTIHQPAHPSLRGHARIIALGLFLIAAGTVTSYMFTFMTTYAQTSLHMAPGVSLAATSVNGLCGAVFGLVGGLLADRFGRKPMMIWPRVGFILAIWPAFALMVRFHNPWALWGGVAVLSVFSAMTTISIIVAITESLRKEVRGAVMGTIYAGAVAIFGGTTQPIIEALIHWTGNPIAPAWYVMAFSLAGLGAALMMKETAPARVAVRG